MSGFFKTTNAKTRASYVLLEIATHNIYSTITIAFNNMVSLDVSILVSTFVKSIWNIDNDIHERYKSCLNKDENNIPGKQEKIRIRKNLEDKDMDWFVFPSYISWT